MNKNLLTCSLHAPGTPFTVKETIKDNTFIPGTYGFISLLSGPDYTLHNIGFLKVIILRKGKKGKARINTNNILTPLFQLPEDKYPEKLIPTEEELKYLVGIETEENRVINMCDKNTSDDEFLGWLLARTLFAYELSKVTYPSDNKIMRVLGINGGQRMVAWCNKGALLEKFRKEIENPFNDGEMDRMYGKYCTQEAKFELLTQLRKVEARLIIPRLEYQRRVNEVLMGALKMMEVTIQEEKDFNNKENTVEKIIATKEWVKTNGDVIKSAIYQRVGLISKNREILNF